jgi:hypothetical protein
VNAASWTPENITALVAALTALAGLFLHARNPNAHQGPPPLPEPPAPASTRATSPPPGPPAA